MIIAIITVIAITTVYSIVRGVTRINFIATTYNRHRLKHSRDTTVYLIYRHNRLVTNDGQKTLELRTIL